MMPAQPRAAAIDLVQLAPERSAGDLGRMFGGFLNFSISSVTVNINPTYSTVSQVETAIEEEFDNVVQDVNFD